MEHFTATLPFFMQIPLKLAPHSSVPLLDLIYKNYLQDKSNLALGSNSYKPLTQAQGDAEGGIGVFYIYIKSNL